MNDTLRPPAAAVDAASDHPTLPPPGSLPSGPPRRRADGTTSPAPPLKPVASQSGSPPEPDREQRVGALLAGLKRFRWWDARAGSTAASLAIREHIAEHLDRLAPFGLRAEGEPLIAEVTGSDLDGAALDPRWHEALARASESVERLPAEASTPSALHLAHSIRDAIDDTVGDPRAVEQALALVAREIEWIRRAPPKSASPFAPLLSVFALGAWPVGLTVERYFVVRRPRG